MRVLMEPVKIPGLELVKPLGRGASSVVYLAQREGKQYAVKCIRHARDGSEGRANRLRFRREATLLARMRHPGLPAVLSFGEADDQAYLVMEYVPGQTLASMLDGGRLGEAHIARISIDVASALMEVHRHGLLHRDVKPQNIIIEPSGHARLIDFGLAMAEDERVDSMQIAGTLLYTAPEQARMLNRPVDARADLYSLGAVMFQCATGRVPFESTDPAALLSMHLNAPVPDVLALNPDISVSLSAIIAKLLEKDPDDRYQTARGLITDLGLLGALNERVRAGRELKLGEDDDAAEVEHAVPLVGRDPELARLKECLSRVLRGTTGTALLVEGAPGGGKSRLIDELLLWGREQGALVLRGKCQRENPVPFAPIRFIIDAYLHRLERMPSQQRAHAQAEARRAVGEYAPALRQFTPRLAALLPDAPLPADLASARDQFYDAVVHFLIQIAHARGPLTLFLDDVQWLDDASRNLLVRLARSLSGTRLLLVCASRNDPESLDAVRALLKEANDAFSVHMSLPPLPQEAVALMISQHLGGADIPREIVDYVFARSAGSPFAVREYILAMLDSGVVEPSWGEWRAEPRRLAKMELPADVADLVVRRVDDLNGPTRSVLSAAAVFGSRFRAEILPDVCDLPRPVVLAALAEATTANLIERSEEGTRFVHDRIYEVLLGSLDPARQQALHLKIARVLETSGSSELEVTYQLARHCALAGALAEPQGVFDKNLEAGKRALANYAAAEAQAFLRVARDAAQRASLPESAELERALGVACMRTGRMTEAREHLGRSIELSPDSLQRASAHALLSKVCSAELQNRVGWSHFEKALDELGYARSKTKLGQIATIVGAVLGGNVIERTNIGYGTVTGEKRERYQSLVQVYDDAVPVAYGMFDRIILLETFLRPFFYAHRVGPSRGLAKVYANYGVLLTIMKQYDAGERYAQKAIRMAEALGDPFTLAKTRLFHCWCAGQIGNELEIEARYRKTIKDCSAWFDGWEYISCMHTFAWHVSLRGFEQEAVELLNTAIRHLQDRHDVLTYQMTFVYSQLAASLATLGRRGEALEAMKQATMLAEFAPEDVHHWAVLYGHKLVLHLQHGELGDELEETITRFQKLKLAPQDAGTYHGHFYIHQPWARLAQCEAATGPRRGELLALVESAIDQLRNSPPIPLIRVHVAMLEGAVHRLRKDFSAAREALAKAEKLAEELESPLIWLELFVQRARLFGAMGQPTAASVLAGSALELATSNGWRDRERTLRAEFHIELNKSSTTRSGTLSSTVISGRDVTVKRYLQALLQIGRAVAKVFDPDQLAVIVLDTVVQIFRAERALLFRRKPGSKELQFQIGRDAEGRPLAEPGGHSSTVVERVGQSREAMVVSGTREGEAIGSVSAIVHDLRSIMAAPLVQGDELLGVVYIDNRAARGVFHDDDKDVLQAISNHIAIALETARAAQRESERRALERDMMLTAAVQSLFMPRLSDVDLGRVRLAGYHRPAQHCGGDWWWYDTLADGTVLVFVGDVTGHGPPAAMITAAVGGIYRSLRLRGGTVEQVPHLIDTIHQTLREITEGEFQLTFAAAAIDPKQSQLTLWSAAFPRPVLCRAGGGLMTLASSGVPLGSRVVEQPAVTVDRAQLRPGDRVVIYTDGVTELRGANGREFGIKSLSSYFRQICDAEAGDVVKKLAAKLDEVRGDQVQEDDVTFVVIEYT